MTRICSSPLLSSTVRILAVGLAAGLLAAWFLASLGDARSDADGWRQRAEVAEQLEARAQARKTVLKAKIAVRDQAIAVQAANIRTLVVLVHALRAEALKPVPPAPKFKERFLELQAMGLPLEPGVPGKVQMPEEATATVWTWGKQAERVPLLEKALEGEHQLSEARGQQINQLTDRARLSDEALKACEDQVAAADIRAEALKTGTKKQYWRGLRHGAAGGGLGVLLLVLLL
jgi:hypothetical protein